MSTLDSSQMVFSVWKPSLTLQRPGGVFVRFRLWERIHIHLLHHVFTEGISILGAEQLHILEPMFDVTKLLQLQARV